MNQVDVIYFYRKKKIYEESLRSSKKIRINFVGYRKLAILDTELSKKLNQRKENVNRKLIKMFELVQNSVY